MAALHISIHKFVWKTFSTNKSPWPADNLFGIFTLNYTKRADLKHPRSYGIPSEANTIYINKTFFRYYSQTLVPDKFNIDRVLIRVNKMYI
jgi:hypothetical protein